MSNRMFTAPNCLEGRLTSSLLCNNEKCYLSLIHDCTDKLKEKLSPEEEARVLLVLSQASAACANLLLPEDTPDFFGEDLQK